MQVFKIYIQSKYKNYISKFVKLLIKKSKTHIKLISNSLRKKTSKFFFSILTSPHNNKKAQEQFETRIYKCHLKIETLEPLKLIILLKQIYSHAFPNLKLKLKLKVHKITKKFFIKSLSRVKTPIVKKKLIKLLDCYGV
jgi:ribosomal protein S10